MCQPDSTLTVTFDKTGATDDLCSPSVISGYLGAENQAIRVQIVDGTHVTWGFDNGGPLYRVTVGADNKTVTVQTEPKDQAHWMQAGQTVLDNGKTVPFQLNDQAAQEGYTLLLLPKHDRAPSKTKSSAEPLMNLLSMPSV